MTDVLLDAMKSEIADIEKSISTITTDVTIPLDVFEKYTLPLLADRGKDFDPQAWLNISGHPNSALRVVDTNGDLLYRIPPMLEGTDIRTRKGMSLTGFAGDLNNIVADNPARKDTVLYGVLKGYTAKDNDMIVASINSTIDLNIVYAAYKMPLIEIDDKLAELYKSITGKSIAAVSAATASVKDKADETDIFDEGFDLA